MSLELELELKLSPVHCLVCTEEVELVQVEEEEEQDLCPKTPNPGSSGSSSTCAAKLISPEQSLSVLFRHVLGLDLPPNIYTTQLKCKNESPVSGSQIKFCKSCLTGLTQVHGLVKICKELDPPNSATLTCASSAENERQEFMELRNAILAGLKLLKPRARTRSMAEEVLATSSMKHDPDRDLDLEQSPAISGELFGPEPPTSSPAQIHEQAQVQVVGIAYICGACGANFKDHDSLKLHDDEAHHHHHHDDQPKSFPGAPTAQNSFPATVALPTVTVIPQKRRQPSASATTPLSTEKMHKCSLCPAKFTSSWNVKRHLAVLHDQKLSGGAPEKKKKFQCHLCPAKLAHEHNLKRHLEVHSGEAAASQCPSCLKRFKHKTNLQSHLKTQGGAAKCAKLAGLPIDAKIKCELCPAVFVKEWQLKQHMKRHAPDSDRPFGCPQCPAKFVREWEAKRHLPVHGRANAFECGGCGKLFARKFKLEAHLSSAHGAGCAAKIGMCGSSSGTGSSSGSSFGSGSSTPNLLIEPTTFGNRPTEQEQEQIVGLGTTTESFESTEILEEKIVPDLYLLQQDQGQNQDQILTGGLVKLEDPSGSGTSGSGSGVAQEVLTRFLCRLCGAIFEDSDSLEQHGKSHAVPAVL